LLNYGDFIDGSTSNTSNPYVQILSTTDPAEAHADFVATRLGGKDTTGSQHLNGSRSSKKSFFQMYSTIILFAAAVVALCML